MRTLLFGMAIVFTSVPAVGGADDPPVTFLWENGPPGFEARRGEKEIRDRINKDTGEFRTTNIHNPYMTVFLPPKEKATGSAVVIAPGGGQELVKIQGS